MQGVALLRGEVGEELVLDAADGGVELGNGGRARFGDLDDVTAAVGRITAPSYQIAVLQRVEESDQDAGVYAQPGTEVALAELTAVEVHQHDGLAGRDLGGGECLTDPGVGGSTMPRQEQGEAGVGTAGFGVSSLMGELTGALVAGAVPSDRSLAMVRP